MNEYHLSVPQLTHAGCGHRGLLHFLVFLDNCACRGHPACSLVTDNLNASSTQLVCHSYHDNNKFSNINFNLTQMHVQKSHATTSQAA
jgi:hypothetical protein